MVRYDDYNPSAFPTSGLAGRHVAFVDRVEWIEIADQAARLAALEVGEVDLLDFFSPTLADRVFSSEAVDPVVVMPGEQMGVYLNHLKAALRQQERAPRPSVGVPNGISPEAFCRWE